MQTGSAAVSRTKRGLGDVWVPSVAKLIHIMAMNKTVLSESYHTFRFCSMKIIVSPVSTGSLDFRTLTTVHPSCKRSLRDSSGFSLKYNYATPPPPKGAKGICQFVRQRICNDCINC